MVFYVKVLCACMCYVYVYVCTCDRSELSRWHHGTHVQSWCFVSKTIIRGCLTQSVSFHPLRRGSVRTHGHRALTIHWIGCVYSQCSGNGLEVGYSVGIGRSWSPKWSALCCVHKEWDAQTVAPHAKAELSIWRPNRTTNTVSSYCLDYSRCVDIECSPRVRSTFVEHTDWNVYSLYFHSSDHRSLWWCARKADRRHVHTTYYYFTFLITVNRHVWIFERMLEYVNNLTKDNVDRRFIRLFGTIAVFFFSTHREASEIKFIDFIVYNSIDLIVLSRN